jgi:hypothetical protein
MVILSQYNDYATGWTADVRFPAGAGIFSLCHRVQIGFGSHTASCTTSTGSFFPDVKRPGREADLSPLSNVEVKIAWSCTSTPSYVFMAWCLVKHKIRLHGVVLS